jgi:nucleoside-diphosphate-sugar epimerase
MIGSAIGSVHPLPEEDLEHVFQHTRAYWEEARGKSFFITGGTGFFGLWLLESFGYINKRLGLKANAVVLTRRREQFLQRAPHLAARHDLQFISGDVQDFAFPSGDFPFVIHAAASTISDDGEAFDLLDGIIAGTRRVLDFVTRAGGRKLLFTSSGAVYGPQPANITHVPETYGGAPDPLLMESAYGQGKRLSEQMCVTHAHRWNYEAKIARCFAFAGPHLPLDGRYAIGNFIRDALLQKSIIVAGDGTPVRSYLYAADLAAWLWTILFRGGPGRAYNVGSMSDVTIAQLAKAVAQTQNCESSVRIARVPTPGAAIHRYIPDVSLAKQELGVCESFTLSDAIARTARWCSKHLPQ